jgi:hypothetical protein
VGPVLLGNKKGAIEAAFLFVPAPNRLLLSAGVMLRRRKVLRFEVVQAGEEIRADARVLSIEALQEPAYGRARAGALEPTPVADGPDSCALQITQYQVFVHVVEGPDDGELATEQRLGRQDSPSRGGVEQVHQEGLVYVVQVVREGQLLDPLSATEREERLAPFPRAGVAGILAGSLQRSRHVQPYARAVNTQCLAGPGDPR